MTSAMRAAGKLPPGAPSVLQVGKFYPPHRGGIESHLETLCLELRFAAAVKVVVCNEGARNVRDLVDGIPVVRLGAWATVAGTPFCPALPAEIRRSPSDIVHIHLPNPPALASFFASRHPGALVVSYHSDIVQNVLARLCRPLIDRALNRAAAIIVASADYLDSSAALAPYRAKCRVIPFGVDVARFAEADPERVAGIRCAYGPRIVLAVGRLVYYKGFEHVIDAMGDVDAHLLLAGDGPLRGALEARARHRGIQDRVSILGEVDDILPYYHAADCLVLPSVSRSAAFDIVPVEAMACGKPVIHTQLCSAVPFVSVDGVSGITVRPADPAALAAALRLLFDRDELRARLGAGARRRAWQEFSAARMAERTLALYREVLHPPMNRQVLYTATAGGVR